MTYDTLQAELKKIRVLTPINTGFSAETHLRTTDIAGSPFSKIVSTTACTERAVEMPTLS
jgi:hypothetical protein